MSQIAVLLATYNAGDFLSEQLNSLLSQSEKNFRIYIHDDGSNDNTLDIIREYMSRTEDKIELLEYPSTGGARNNFLSMLNCVEADYYMFCDHDDVWLPEKVEATFDKMKQLENSQDKAVAVFSDLKVVDRNLNVISNSFMEYMHRCPKAISYRELLVQNVAPGCTMMINKKLAEIGKSYTDRNNIFMHDWWFMLIASLVGEIGYIETPLILYRQHGKNAVGASKNQFKWLVEKMKNVLKGKQLKSSREGILYQRRIAYELLQIPEVLEDDKAFLWDLSNIADKSKLQRIRFYKENKLLKANAKNAWKLLLV